MSVSPWPSWVLSPPDTFTFDALGLRAHHPTQRRQWHWHLAVSTGMTGVIHWCERSSIYLFWQIACGRPQGGGSDSNFHVQEKIAHGKWSKRLLTTPPPECRLKRFFYCFLLPVVVKHVLYIFWRRWRYPKVSPDSGLSLKHNYVASGGVGNF